MVARCSITYSGRLSTRLAEATRLLMFKADGTFMVWSDHTSQSVKPLNWMTPPTVIEESPERIVVRKRARASEDRLEIDLAEVLSDVTHEMGSPESEAGLAKDGVEAHLQELLADQPQWCGEGFRLVRREWPTDIGPVDLMCRDAEDGWVAVEIKRVAGIEAVRAADPLPGAHPPGSRLRAVPGRAGRPGDQAPGPDPGRGTGDRLRRGGP